MRPVIASLIVLSTAAFGFWYLRGRSTPSDAEIREVWGYIADVGKLTGPCAAKGNNHLACLCAYQAQVRALLRRANSILEKYPAIQNQTLHGGTPGREYKIEVKSLRTAEQFRCPKSP